MSKQKITVAHDSDPDVQASKDEIAGLIAEPGLDADERDTVYNSLRAFTTSDRVSS